METKVNYHWLPNSIVLNFGGKTFTVHKEDSRHPRILEAIKESRFSDIPRLVDAEAILDGTPFKLVDGTVIIPGEGALPEAVSKRIIELRKEGLPIEPLIKFWDKLKKNPSFNSRLQLYDFLEHNGHPLTEDGNFIAYRGVRDDLKDCHTGTFDNSPGSTCEMPREQVDDNPNNTCSFGLHVAGFDFAQGFGSKLVEVEVDPSDVVAVPPDYNGTKMRVCRFKVVALGEEMRTEPLYGHSSTSQEEAEDFDFSEDDSLEELRAERDDIEYAIESFDPMSDDIDDLIAHRARLGQICEELAERNES